MWFFLSVFGSRLWEHVRDILNPDTSRGADPWVYYMIYAFCVFIFNIIDIVSKLLRPYTIISILGRLCGF